MTVVTSGEQVTPWTQKSIHDEMELNLSALEMEHGAGDNLEVILVYVKKARVHPVALRPQ